ncbi:hypothetical protein O181_015156 [Austropuccinia psidii MF-1]|uniref:Protein HIR n=1 Tax=Austropuccinia psidii MF-1 TaxID=1389203 RepID=A0A9Q3BZG2_9BASI|nr:hypothetical protein [Austropuccinia psidii MF-1]
MQIVKPNWVMHEDDKRNPQTIYSVHVHPDGTRLATGSIQNVVKIWSTAPILDREAEAKGEENFPRLLCRMEGHDGAVLCVRWTYSGGFLATGSDDSIIMVWLRCPGQSKSFGAKTTNIEDWKPFKRLAGHTSDVSGLAWSHDDQYLASVGLDNLVLVWDCLDSAFILLRRLDLHQGHVNGVTWDPVGQYLATQSDDRTVKIWRTTDWKLEADITDPFIASPRSFFRRLSWSPDGAHLVSPNAMNGPVFVSAVIDRNNWTSNISLVGHENVVEVAAYNPQLFLREKNLPGNGFNLCAALALGARNSISVWLTNCSIPLVVLHDVFDRDILDLSWANDGITLYACSSEGRVAVLVIEELQSIVAIAPAEAKKEYHATYAFTKPDRRQQSQALSASNGSRYASPMPYIEPYKPGISSQQPATSSLTATLSRPSDSLLAQQEMTIMPNGKRRIKPVFLGANETFLFSTTQANRYATPSAQNPLIQTSHSNRLLEFNSQASLIQPQSLPGFLNSPMTLSSSPFGLGKLIHWDTNNSWGDPVEVPDFLTKTVGEKEHKLQIDCRNLQESLNEKKQQSSETKLFSVDPKKLIWNKTLQGRRVVAVAATLLHVALGCNDKTLWIFNRSGRRSIPLVLMDGPCVKLHFREHMLMAISSIGTLNIWNLKECKAMGPPIRLSDLDSAKRSISFSALTGSGSPVIGLKNGSMYTYDRDLLSWVLLVDGLTDSPKTPSVLEQLKFVDGLSLSLDAAMVLCSKSQLEACLTDHARKLKDERVFAGAEELCKELWTGCWSGLSSQASSSGKLELSKEDRLKLLYKVIQIFCDSNEFQSIVQEYSILLKHSQQT